MLVAAFFSLTGLILTFTIIGAPIGIPMMLVGWLIYRKSDGPKINKKIWDKLTS